MEESNLAEQSVDEMVFSKFNLSSDENDRLKACILSCLGEDLLAFEANGEGLIQSCTYNKNGENHHLELEWSPIVNEQTDEIDKLLITLRDVSEIINLREESQLQQAELAFISEVMKVPAAKFAKFISIANEFIHENITRLQDSSTYDRDTIDCVFINLHTLKRYFSILPLK